MLIAIFAMEYFLAWLKKKSRGVVVGGGGGVINKRCNLLQGTGSHWRMRA